MSYPAKSVEKTAAETDALRHKQLLVAAIVAGAIATGNQGKLQTPAIIAWAKPIAEQIISAVQS